MGESTPRPVPPASSEKVGPEIAVSTVPPRCLTQRVILAYTSTRLNRCSATPRGKLMSSCAELLDRLEPEEHVVQLYGADDRLLTGNVGRYLSEGLKRGDGLLVIASPEHRSTLVRQLREDTAYPKAVLEGRLVFLDAATTLARFMVNGVLDPARFHAAVGQALRGVQLRAVHTGVRAYGEMVGLLWKATEYTAAIQLEQLWN